MAQETRYDYRGVKGFAIVSLSWGVARLLIGIMISLQLVCHVFAREARGPALHALYNLATSVE